MIVRGGDPRFAGQDMAKALAIESVPVPAGGGMATLDEELAAIIHPVNELRHSTLYRLALTNAGLGLLVGGRVIRQGSDAVQSLARIVLPIES